MLWQPPSRAGVGARDVPGLAQPGRVAGGSAIAGGPRPPRPALPVGAHSAEARAVARLGNPDEGPAALRAVVRVAGTPLDCETVWVYYMQREGEREVKE